MTPERLLQVRASLAKARTMRKPRKKAAVYLYRSPSVKALAETEVLQSSRRNDDNPGKS
jgi:hypothetical protein